VSGKPPVNNLRSVVLATCAGRRDIARNAHDLSERALTGAIPAPDALHCR
jgi:hypothetical protein